MSAFANLIYSKTMLERTEKKRMDKAKQKEERERERELVSSSQSSQSVDGSTPAKSTETKVDGRRRGRGGGGSNTTKDDSDDDDENQTSRSTGRSDQFSWNASKSSSPSPTKKVQFDQSKDNDKYFPKENKKGGRFSWSTNQNESQSPRAKLPSAVSTTTATAAAVAAQKKSIYDDADSDSSCDFEWPSDKKSDNKDDSSPSSSKGGGIHTTKKGDRLEFSSGEEDAEATKTTTNTTNNNIATLSTATAAAVTSTTKSGKRKELPDSPASSVKSKRSSSASTLPHGRRSMDRKVHENSDDHDDDSDDSSATGWTSQKERKKKVALKHRRRSRKGGCSSSEDNNSFGDDDESDESSTTVRDRRRRLESKKKRQHQQQRRSPNNRNESSSESGNENSIGGLENSDTEEESHHPPRKRVAKNPFALEQEMMRKQQREFAFAAMQGGGTFASNRVVVGGRGGGGGQDDDSDGFWSDCDPAPQEKEKEESKSKKKPKTKKLSSGYKTCANKKQPSSASEKKKRLNRRASKSSGMSDHDDNMDDSFDDVVLDNDDQYGADALHPTLVEPAFGPDELVPLVLTREVASEADEEQHAIPASLNRYLAPFQREGVEFMYKVLTRGSGVILGDEMGCGKTVQVIALLCALFNKTGTNIDLKKVNTQKRLARRHMEDLRRARQLAESRCEIVKDSDYAMKGDIELSPWSPVLMIAPPTIVEVWKKSFAVFSHFSVVEYVSKTKAAALETIKSGGADVMLLPKSKFQEDSHFGDINEIPWKLVIIDEFHLFKGIKSKNVKHLRELKKTHSPLVLGMTGTLMQNKHDELWNLVDLIETGFFGTASDFKENFGKPISYGRQKGADPNVVAKSDSASAALQKALATIMIERKKRDVLGEQLMDKTEELILCDLSPLQKEVYRHVVELPDFDIIKRGNAPCDCGVNRHFFQKFYRLATKAEQVNYYRHHKNEIVKQSMCCKKIPLNPRRNEPGEPKIDPDAAIWRTASSHNKGDETAENGCDKCPWCCCFPCLSKLSKLSSHVGLIQAEKIPENEQRGSPAYVKYMAQREFAKVALAGVVGRLPGGDFDRTNSIKDSHYYLSGKLVVLDRLLTAFYKEGSRVLLFAHSTQLLDLIQTWLKSRGSYAFKIMTGQTKTGLRQYMAEDFNRDDSTFLFLLSIKAMGTGLTLTGANRVIIFDVDWNPSWDEQAQDRAHRIGQSRDVKVVRLISKGTVEEMVYLRQIYKTHLKRETLERNDETHAAAPRLFNGVQGDKERKGELFGVENLFRFKDGSFLEDIWAESGSKGEGGLRSIGGYEVHDTAQLSSALLGIGDDFERVLEEKDAVDDLIAANTRRARDSDDSDSDSEMEDTMNIKTRALNHGDLMRSDKGGAKIASNGDAADEEMGEGTQDAFHVFEKVARPELGSDDENSEDGSDLEMEPNDVFKKPARSNFSEAAGVDTTTSGSSVPHKTGSFIASSSAAPLAPSLTVTASATSSESVDAPSADNDADSKATTNATEKANNEPKATLRVRTNTIRDDSAATISTSAPAPEPVNSASECATTKRKTSLFGCGSLDKVETSFSAADLGLGDFAKKTKKKKKRDTTEKSPS